jgi:hypothetical protein
MQLWGWGKHHTQRTLGLRSGLIPKIGDSCSLTAQSEAKGYDCKGLVTSVMMLRRREIFRRVRLKESELLGIFWKQGDHHLLV